MFIERNGVKIELTKEELVRAYLEQDAIYHKNDALVFFADFVGVDANFEFDVPTLTTFFPEELKAFEAAYGFSFLDAINPESEFYVVDKIVKAYDDNYSTDVSPYNAWTRACKGVVEDMARMVKGERMNARMEDLNLQAIIVEAVENIRGMGVTQGSGFYTVKRFDLYGESFNVNCEIFKEQQGGNAYYGVYFDLGFDGGKELFSDWAYTETLDLDELKALVSEIANADYSKDVQSHIQLDALDLNDNTRKCLEDARITTLYDIVAIGKDGLLNIPGFEFGLYGDVFAAVDKIGVELPEGYAKTEEIVKAVDASRLTPSACVTVCIDERELGETVYVNHAYLDAEGLRETCVCVDVVYDSESELCDVECVFEELDFWATSRPNALTVAKAISEAYGIPINNCLEAQKPLETVLGEAGERSAGTDKGQSKSDFVKE